MRLTSDAFAEGERIPDRYARTGDNVAPPLDWTDVPAGAAELVLLCEDIDTGHGNAGADAGADAGEPPFVHWVLTGLEADLDGIGEGEQLEDARPGVNGFGEARYDGPEPPAGEQHRYVFTLVAVSSPIEPDLDVREELPARELDRATLTGTYSG
jgi:Raf kinase inhibitor-like YbhB/YbcL family protein